MENLKITDPTVCRAIANDPNFISVEAFQQPKTNKHEFNVGDVCILHNLQNFPEFNGTEVEITSIRENGEWGRAYYIKGRINEYLNWVYEYRLIKK